MASCEESQLFDDGLYRAICECLESLGLMGSDIHKTFLSCATAEAVPCVCHPVSNSCTSYHPEDSAKKLLEIAEGLFKTHCNKHEYYELVVLLIVAACLATCRIKAEYERRLTHEDPKIDLRSMTILSNRAWFENRNGTGAYLMWKTLPLRMRFGEECDGKKLTIQIGNTSVPISEKKFALYSFVLIEERRQPKDE